VAADGAEIERERRLPAPLVEELRAAGMFHLMVPAAYGGAEADPLEALAVVEELSSADGSVGWCAMLAAQAGAYAAFFAPEAAEEIFGGRQTTAGVGRPIGRAVPVTGVGGAGWTVSGRWPFASGSSHADWFSGEALVYPDGGTDPLKDASGNDVVVTFMTRRANVTVYDTWDTLGLRGTASNDFSVDGLFVPQAHAADFAGGPRVPLPVYRCEPLIFMNHGAHALGIARAALEAARDVVNVKRGWGAVPLRDVTRMQVAVAEATAMVESARAWFFDSAAMLWADVQAQGGGGEPLLRSRARLAGSHAANQSIAAVDLLHRALATSAVQVASPLDRQFRDIHTAGAHVMVGPLTYEAAGRVELGMPADFPLF